jgi:hypothetical protein
MRFVPWVALMFLLLIPGNRGTGIWKAVVPAAVLQLVVILAEIYWMTAAGFVTDLLVVMAFSLSFLWLMSGAVAVRCSPGVAVACFSWLMGAALFFVLCLLGLPPGISFLGLMFCHGLLAAVVVISMAAAWRMCRQRCTWGRFHARVFMMILALCLVPTPLLLLLAVAQFATLGDAAMVVGVVGAGLAVLAGTGVVLYVLVATYLGIARRVPVLNDRLQLILGLGHPEPVLEPPAFTGLGPEGKELV